MLKSQPQTVLLVPVGTAQFQPTAFLQLQGADILKQQILNNYFKVLCAQE